MPTYRLTAHVPHLAGIAGTYATLEDVALGLPPGCVLTPGGVHDGVACPCGDGSCPECDDEGNCATGELLATLSVSP